MFSLPILCSQFMFRITYCSPTLTHGSWMLYDKIFILWNAAQDSQDPNPLIRALAVRTMGCIRVDKITEYLYDPLQRCLKVHIHNSFIILPCLFFSLILFLIVLIPVTFVFGLTICNPCLCLIYIDRTMIHMFARQQPFVLQSCMT